MAVKNEVEIIEHYREISKYIYIYIYVYIYIYIISEGSNNIVMEYQKIKSDGPYIRSNI